MDVEGICAEASSSDSEGSSTSECRSSNQSESGNDSARSDSDLESDDEDATSLSLSSCSDVKCGASDTECMELSDSDPITQSLTSEGNDKVRQFIYQTDFSTVSSEPVAPLLLRSSFLVRCMDGLSSAVSTRV